jgi:hypothetical protein
MITLKQYQKFVKENPVGHLYGITDTHKVDGFMPTAYVVKYNSAGVETHLIEAAFSLQEKYLARDVFLTWAAAANALVSQLTEVKYELKKTIKKWTWEEE